MKSLRISAVAVSVLALCMTGPTVTAKGKAPTAITVAFGTGNNNATAGNTPNHHILPQEFKVRLSSARKLDGTLVPVPATVNFIVAGFHSIWVYNPGVMVEDVVVPAAGTFVNYNVNVFARGLFPGTPPTFTDITSQGAAALFPLNPAQNRTETFAFSIPGKYLVICNVRGHFIDGMYAWVHVLAEDEDDDDDQG
jgi:hypothetical protein